MIGTIRLVGATHPGRRRDNNEDAFHIDVALCAAILADGMGGQNCGEVGSEITVRATLDYLKHPEPNLTLEETAMEAIRSANREVIAEARRRPECDGMGSTIVLALWRLPELVLANVGDSRGYLFRGGVLRQLSYDQNFANELRTKLGLSEEHVRSMPNRNVLTMAVGSFEQVLVRTHIEQIQPGDRILLCSDGLHGPVREKEIAAIIGSSMGLQDTVERLIFAANENGGPDNVTAVLLEFGNEADG